MYEEATTLERVTLDESLLDGDVLCTSRRRDGILAAWRLVLHCPCSHLYCNVCKAADEDIFTCGWYDTATCNKCGGAMPLEDVVWIAI